MRATQTVLVVDDEVRIVEVLRDYFEAGGFGVRVAGDGAEALRVIAGEPVDCVLLDIMMPGPSGFDICRQIRQASPVPVLFLTARDAEADKLRGLGLGDDYIVKVASPSEIVARVRMVLRRTRYETQQARGDQVLDFGRLVIDVDAHEVRVAGVAVGLTPREFSLLHLLAQHPHQVLSRDVLLERIWEGFADEGTVWAYIRRLREKIEHDPSAPRLIVTIWGVGYRFEGVPR